MSKRRDRKGRTSTARRRAEARDQNRGGNSYIKLPEGMKAWEPDGPGPYRLDFFPYRVGDGNPYADKGEEHMERTFHIHKNVGPNKRWVICPRKTAEQSCPICEDVDRLRADSDEDDKEAQQMIKDLLPKERQIWLLKDRTGDTPDEWQIWDYSFHMFGKQLDGRVKDGDEEDEYDFYYFLDGGKTLRVGFEEKSFNGAKYYETRSIDFKDREDYPESLLDEAPCLDDLLNILPYDKLREMYLQEPDDEDEENDEKAEETKEEKKPRRRKQKEEKKPKEEPPKDEEPAGGDDDWDEEPEAEPEPEPKPKKEEKPKRKQTRKPKKEEPKEEPPEKPETVEDEGAEDAEGGGDDDWDDDW